MRGLVFLTVLALGGCGLFSSAPTKNEIYALVQNMEGQPFGVDGVACKSAGDGYDCLFDATVITGYQTTGVADRRPDYKRVRMSGRFTKTGEKWAAAQISQTADAPTTN